MGSILENIKKEYLNWDFAKSILYIIVGCFIFSLGAVLFIEPYGFAPGGTYGIGMILHHALGLETEFVALCLDVPLLIIGTLILGRQFGVKTLIATLVMPACMFVIHKFYGYGALLEPGISDRLLMKNQLLSCLFGGLLYGIGLGVIFKSRSTSGGTDIVAMIIKKYLHLTMGNAMMVIDGVICISTVVVFQDWTLPLYSAIVIMIFTRVSDRLIEGEPMKTMFIITDKMEEVRKIIIDDLGRGATLIPGKGMYKGVQRDTIYVVLSRREMITLRYKIAAIDPRAFINVVNSYEILGEGFGDINQL